MNRAQSRPCDIDWGQAIPDQPIREAITYTTAQAFVAGGLVRLMLRETLDLQDVFIAASYFFIGAIIAALLAGIFINLIVLPMVGRLMPDRRAPDFAYVAAGTLSGLAAFGSAMV